MRPAGQKMPGWAEAVRDQARDAGHATLPVDRAVAAEQLHQLEAAQQYEAARQADQGPAAEL